MARVSAAPAALDHQAVATALAAALVLLTVAHWLVQAVLRVLKSLLKWHRQAFVLRPAPMAPGYLPLIGHTVALFKAVGNYPCTWDLFSLWATEKVEYLQLSSVCLYWCG